jgi:acyl carrier protein
MDMSSLCKLIEEALEVDQGLVTVETDSNDIPEWDSLGHITIIMKLTEVTKEQAGDIPDLAGANSVKEIFENLQKNGLA